MSLIHFIEEDGDMATFKQLLKKTLQSGVIQIKGVEAKEGKPSKLQTYIKYYLKWYSDDPKFVCSNFKTYGEKIAKRDPKGILTLTKVQFMTIMFVTMKFEPGFEKLDQKQDEKEQIYDKLMKIKAPQSMIEGIKKQVQIDIK